MFTTSGVARADDYIELYVVRNDYLIAICKSYIGSSEHWKEIAQLNKLKNPDLIFPGQKLMIPTRYLKELPFDGIASVLTGSVDYRPNDKDEWQPLRQNDAVKHGGEIRTGGTGKVTVLFPDKSYFRLHQNTQISLKASLQPAKGDSVREFFLTKGSAYSHVTPLKSSKSRYEIHTGTAIAGVRGTAFSSTVESDGTPRFEVFEGTVVVNAAKQEIALYKGEGIRIPKDVGILSKTMLPPPPEPAELRMVYYSFPVPITFKPVAGAARYKVELSRTADFSMLLIDQEMRAGETISLTSAEGGVFYLRARSVNEQGLEGANSQTYTFTVDLGAQIPSFTTPLSGNEFTEPRVLFTWDAMKGAESYRLQVSRDPSFSSTVIDVHDVKGTKHEAALPELSEYFARIQYRRSDGADGPWSPTLSFRRIMLSMRSEPQAPQKINLEPPAMTSARTEGFELALAWAPVSQAKRYAVQISADPSFSNPIHMTQTKEPQFSMPKAGLPDNVYVRVIPLDVNQKEGPASAIQQVATKEKSSPFKSQLGILAIALLLFLAL